MGTVDEYPEAANLDVCIDEDPLHIAGASVLRPMLQDPVPVHLELKDASMEDTIVEEHLRGGHRRPRSSSSVCNRLLRVSARRERGRERAR